MTNGRLSWTERLDAIQDRLNEAFVAVDPQIGIPYFDRSEIERVLLEVSNANLRECSIEDLDVVASDAVVELSGASPLSYNAASIDIISARIDSKPCIEVTPMQYFQLNYGVTTAMYTVYDGKIYHTGTSGTFEILKYLTLAQWQATYDILPPAYDEKTIAETCEILEGLADYAPVERI